MVPYVDINTTPWDFWGVADGKATIDRRIGSPFG